jgi:hypothetical protein
MTTMMNPHANGRKRASLNEQINRLDSVLDGLSENLNDAVADAVKAAVGLAVKEAVQTVLKEVLTNPALLAKFPVPTAPPAEPILAPALANPKTVSFSQRLANRCRSAFAWIASRPAACRQSLRNLGTSAGRLWQHLIARLKAVCACTQLLRPFKYQIFTSLTIGTLMAVLVYHAGPWMAALNSGVGGFATSLMLQAGLWLRQLLKVDAPEMA